VWKHHVRIMAPAQDRLRPEKGRRIPAWAGLFGIKINAAAMNWSGGRDASSG
jgi:hypothetical protein